jgi:phage baseplate assembly protein W
MGLFLVGEVVRQQDSNIEFYPTLTSRGIKRLSGADVVINYIRSLLSVDTGTIFYMRKYGTILRKKLFDPLDQETLTDLQTSLTESITTNLPMVDLETLDAYVDSDPTTGRDIVYMDIAFTFDKDTYSITYNLSTDTYVEV